MPVLNPIEDPNVQPLALDTNSRNKPIVPGDKVRMTEPVPGDTVNSADDWRAHQETGLAAVRETAKSQGARIAALGEYLDPDGYVPGTPAQTEAGYAFFVVDAELAANSVPTTWTGVDESSPVLGMPAGALSVFLRVPSGADPYTVKVDHHRADALIETFPRVGQEWASLAGENGRSTNFDYYFLGAGGAVLVDVSGVDAGDLFDARVHPPESVKSAKNVVESFDALPRVAGYPTGKYVLVDGLAYELTTAPDADTITGAAAQDTDTESNVFLGVVLPGLPDSLDFHTPVGRFDHNPTYGTGGEPAIWSVLWAVNSLLPTTRFIVCLVLADAYKDAAGSDAEPDASSQFRIDAAGNSQRAEVVMTYSETITVAGRSYYNFQSKIENYGDDAETQHPQAFRLHAMLASGADLTFTFYAGAQSVAARRLTGFGALGWSPRHDSVTVQNQAGVIRNVTRMDTLFEDLEQLGDAYNYTEHRVETDDKRISALEAKSSATDLPVETVVWGVVEPTENTDGASYGKFIALAGGDDADNYASLDYTGVDAHTRQWLLTRDQDDIGVVWVIPDAVTRNNARLIHRGPDRRIKNQIGAAAMRQAPSTVVVANAPESGFTTLWISEGDNPHSFGNFAVGDSITIETLSDEHRPVWEGGLVFDADATDRILELARDIGAWEWTEPDTGPPTFNFDSNNEGPGHRLRDIADIDADLELRDKILAARTLGVPVQLELEFDIDLHLNRELGAGAIITLDISLGIAPVSGATTSNTRHVMELWDNSGNPQWDHFTISEFGRAHVRNPGAYGPVPDISARVQRTLDPTGWALTSTDKFVFDLFANNFAGYASMRIILRNMKMRLTVKSARGSRLDEIIAQTAPFLTDSAATTAVISAAWTIPNAGTSIFAIGTGGNRIRVPKVLPDGFYAYRVECRVADVVKHAITVPVGWYGQRAMFAADNQRVIFQYEFQFDQSYDIMYVNGGATTLPLNTRIVVYQVRQ